MIKNSDYVAYRKRLQKAIDKAKTRTNVTDIYKSMGISRGNISGFLNGDTNRLSYKTVDLLIKKLEDPETCVTNQQILSASKPKKAANMLSDLISNILDVKLSPNKKAELSLDLEKWLRNSKK